MKHADRQTEKLSLGYLYFTFCIRSVEMLGNKTLVDSCQEGTQKGSERTKESQQIVRENDGR